MGGIGVNKEKIWDAKDIIRLFWWHHGSPNMGDEASRYIVDRLSVSKVERADIPINLKTGIKRALRSLFYFKRPDLGFLIDWIRHEPVLMGLGSILRFSTSECVIWGSGFQEPGVGFFGGRILAVRGHKTAEEFKKRGIDVPSVYGDPGLLMPLIYRPDVSRVYDIGIIPHIRELNEVSEIADRYGIKVIDFKTDDVEGTIDEILKCRCVLSSSLHGLIFSHAYGIPALFFTYVHKGEGLFKYYDYFSSVDIPPYNPLNLEKVLCKDRCDIAKIFRESQVSLPKVDLLDLQKRLLAVAPFVLKEEYQ